MYSFQSILFSKDYTNTLRFIKIILELSKHFKTTMKHLGIFCLRLLTGSSGTTIEVRYRFAENRES